LRLSRHVAFNSSLCFFRNSNDLRRLLGASPSEFPEAASLVIEPEFPDYAVQQGAELIYHGSIRPPLHGCRFLAFMAFLTMIVCMSFQNNLVSFGTRGKLPFANAPNLPRLFVLGLRFFPRLIGHVIGEEVRYFSSFVLFRFFSFLSQCDGPP